MEIGESGARFDGARKGGTVWVERELAHGGEGTEGFEGVAAASQIGNDRVPGGDAGFINIFIKQSYEVGIG